MPKARSAEVDLSRLCNAIRSSRKVLEPFRSERREAVRKYAGGHWSTETAQTPRPINFLSLYLSIISRNLISHDPRVMLTTFEKPYKAVVAAMEGWCNREVERMGLADTLSRVVVDALFSLGITKVALASPAESEMSGWNLSAGQPYAARIDLDDWVFDTHARDFSEAAFEGHRSRVRLDSLVDSKLYDAVKRKLLRANPDRQFNESGDERVSMLQRQYVSGDTEEAYEYVDLWEIYLLQEKMVVCLFSEDGGAPSPLDFKGDDAPFYQKDWVGPDRGPYHHLALMPPVPGNAMAKGPVQDLIDMDESLNALTQKLIEQAARQKEVLAASGAADSDAQRIIEARDGEAIRVDNVDRLKPLGFGGPHPSNQAFALSLWELLNKIGGNLELMGGLGQQSKTLGQDKLLNANSSRSVQDMQQLTVHHTADVVRSLAWFYHHHPQKVMTSYHEVAGLAAPIKRQVTPQQRQQVPFEALEIKVDPHSLNYQTPQDRLAFLNNVVTQIVSPLMPLMQQQGIYFDMAKYLEMVGQYGNSPDLTEIITTGQPPPTDGAPEEPAKPQTTTRQYNRVNSSEATSGGQSKAMQQALAGQAAGGRPSSNGTYNPVAR